MLERFKAAAAAAEQAALDLTKPTKGPERKPLPEGTALGVLVEYIEFGKQPQSYNGQAKDPMMEVQLGFALFGEGYQTEEGTPRTISTFSMPLSANEKSRSYKLFKRMNAKGIHKNFASMLGEVFLVPIVHKEYNGKKYANIDLENISIGVDPLTKKPYNVDKTLIKDKQYRFFMWDFCDKEQWDSIEIQNDDPEKNFLQAKCLKAVDFPGSRLQQMLSTGWGEDQQMAQMQQGMVATAQSWDDSDVPF